MNKNKWDKNENKGPGNISIRHDIKPGDTGCIIYLHGVLYSKEEGMDHTFEAYVAEPLAKLIKSGNFNNQRIWIAEMNDQIVGSIAIACHSNEEAQLRWLIVTSEARGKGLGKQLVKKAINFCKDKEYKSVFLWTVSTLKQARNLYLATGFKLTKENKSTRLWGVDLVEQKYELDL